LNNRTEVDHILINKIELASLFTLFFVADLTGLGSFVVSVELNTWKDRVRPEVDVTTSTRATALPHRIMLLLAYWWLHILLHRPFYRTSRARNLANAIDHAKVCVQSSATASLC
jgi:hypothetical protein